MRWKNLERDEFQNEGRSKLIEFHFEIKYMSGRDNMVDDALSRVHYYAISLLQFDFMDEVRLAKQLDIELMDLRIKVHGQNSIYNNYLSRVVSYISMIS